MPFLFKKGTSGFTSRSTAEDVTDGVDGTGLTAIVTGATSGIGTETARVLALRGVHVVMAIRNTTAGTEVKESIIKETPNAKVDVMELDLSSLTSVKKFAAEYISSGLPLNILINNAGIMGIPFTLTKDNIEMQFATNYVGHFLLTNLLLDTMKRTARESSREVRIVHVSSYLHRMSYSEGINFNKINDPSVYKGMAAYGQSKLANILFANQLTRHLKEEGVDITSNSLHPGVVSTNIFRASESFAFGLFHKFGKYFFKNLQQGAATSCYLALNLQVEGMTGEYFEDCEVAKTSAQAKDSELAKKLWDFTMDLVK